MKKYNAPEIEVEEISTEDIMSLSDLFGDLVGGGSFDDDNSLGWA